MGADFLILDTMDLLTPICSAILRVVKPSLRFWGLVGFMVMLAEKEEVNSSLMVARGAQVL